MYDTINMLQSVLHAQQVCDISLLNPRVYNTGVIYDASNELIDYQLGHIELVDFSSMYVQDGVIGPYDCTTRVFVLSPRHYIVTISNVSISYIEHGSVVDFAMFVYAGTEVIVSSPDGKYSKVVQF